MALGVLAILSKLWANATAINATAQLATRAKGFLTKHRKWSILLISLISVGAVFGGGIWFDRHSFFKPSPVGQVAVNPHPEQIPAPPLTETKPQSSPPQKGRSLPRREPVQTPRVTPPVAPPSVSQSGTGNNQTVLPPGVTIQQNANAPCSQNNIGSGNTNNCTINAPVERELSDEQKTALRAKSISDVCAPGKVEIWWEPTVEAASFGDDFVKSLGFSVGLRTQLEARGKGYKGVVLARTMETGAGGYPSVDVPNPCADALRLSFIVAGIKFTPGALLQKWRTPPPPFNPHGTPIPPMAMRAEKQAPETVLFIGTP